MSVKKIDLLSLLITLYADGNLSHSSIFSGILTIAVYTFIIVMGRYFLLDLIERKNPSEFYFNRYLEDSGSFLLNSNSMFNFIEIFDVETISHVPID